MRIGITGANGFLGSNLLRELSKNNECETFDRSRYNLLNIESMQEFVVNKDLILHLGGISFTRDAYNNMIETNVLATSNLLEAIRRYNPKAGIVLASTMQVYAPMQKPTDTVNETFNLNPDSFYGLSKKFAEELVIKYNGDFKIKSVIFRMSNVYGPNARPYHNSVISTFLDLAKNKKSITIFGSGEQMRDFIYIDDVVAAFTSLVNLGLGEKTEIFNICSGKLTSLNNLIDMLENICGNKFQKDFKSAPEKINYLRGDYSKAKSLLLWNPQTPLEEGLRLMCEAFKAKDPH